jgi:uncharacterized protein (DUF2164 family)
VSIIESMFGRVDESGKVYLLDNGTERLIGSQPSMSVEDAVKFYQKRFDDLAANVRLLEQRLKAKADPKSMLKSARKILQELVEPNVLGDVQSLRDRVNAIDSQLAELVGKLDKEREEAVVAAMAAREALVLAAEALVAKDPGKTNYKQASLKMSEILDSWQKLQKEGARIPKAKADALWKRLAGCRNTFESNKRSFFSTQDKLAKSAKQAKNDIVIKAEALVSKGAEGVSEYKALLTAWKALPKTKSKTDDGLWDRFKAAGDAIYAAKAEKTSVEEAAYAANLETKLALLTEAEALDPSANLEAAKSSMKSIQARWEKAGKVPRDSIRKIEDRLKAVETKIRNVEQENWRRTDPTTIDRSNSLKNQIEQAISKLEIKLDSAKSSGDTKSIEQIQAEIETKRSWLSVID